MSTIFKKWNIKKTPKGKEKENTDTKGKAPNFDEGEDFDLPASVPRRPDRNLSISRSGRHKVKRTQRTSVMSTELYTPDENMSRQQTPASHMGWSHDQTVSATKNVQSNTPSSGGNAYHHCRETIDSTSNNLSGSQRMARAPTAV